MGHINMFPDPRNIDDILKDQPEPTVIKYMAIGFVLILSSILGGFFLIINNHEIFGTTLALTAIAIWCYALIRKIKITQ